MPQITIPDHFTPEEYPYLTPEHCSEYCVMDYLGFYDRDDNED